jgi:hypothetical protein
MIKRSLAMLLLAVACFGQTQMDRINPAAVNSVYYVDGKHYTTVQSAVTAAGATGGVVIPPNYAGSDVVTSNPNHIPIVDLRLKDEAWQGAVDCKQEYGAKGDGVTDDTNALLACLRSADAQYNAIGTTQEGRRIHLPRGTYLINNPLYLRRGDVLIGDGGTATNIQSGASFPANQPLIYMGFKSDGTLDSGGLAPVAEGILLQNNASNGVGLQTFNGSSYISGAIIRQNWCNSSICFYVKGNGVTIHDNFCDGSSFHCAKFLGDGTEYANPTHTDDFHNNYCFAQKFACVWIDGANGITINDNIIEYSKFNHIYFANNVSAGTSYNITISGNWFQTSLSASFYDATETDLNLSWPMENVIVSGNIFAKARRAAVYIPVSTAKNVSFSGNQYLDTNDSAVIISAAASGVIFANELFRNVGNYAIDNAAAVISISNSFCTGAFAVAGLPASDFDKGCFRFQNAGTAGSQITANRTDSTTYAVATLRSGATGIYSAMNRSGWATADLYVFGAANQSCNERTAGGTPLPTCVITNGQVLQVNTGVLNSGTGVKHMRITTGICTTTATIANTCTFAATWPGTAFTDTSYTVSCLPQGPSNIPILHWNAKSTTQLTLEIQTATNNAATYAAIDCMAFHD